MFSRYPNNAVQCPSTEFSLDHCYVGLNPRSGIPVLYDLSRHHTTYLDGQQVTPTRSRAMIPQRAQLLRLHTASFQIHWPKVSSPRMAERQSLLLQSASEIQRDENIFDLTDLEVDLHPFEPTAHATRQATPVNEPLTEAPERMKELGSGAFGSVWQAIDTCTGDFVAVKRIRKSADNPPSIREVEVMRDLDHVRCLEFNHSISKNLTRLKEI